MAQKFITKRNRHLFRRPVKAVVEDKIVIILPSKVEEVIPEVVEAEIITPEVLEVEEVVVEEPKKRRNKKVQVEQTEETTIEE